MDSTQVPYIKEAAVILTFYASGVLIFAYIAAFQIKETEYFNGDEDVVIPKQVLSEYAQNGRPDKQSEESVEGIQAEKETGICT